MIVNGCVAFRLGMNGRAPWETNHAAFLADMEWHADSTRNYHAIRQRQIGNGGMKIDDVQTQHFC